MPGFFFFCLLFKMFNFRSVVGFSWAPPEICWVGVFTTAVRLQTEEHTVPCCRAAPCEQENNLAC